MTFMDGFSFAAGVTGFALVALLGVVVLIAIAAVVLK